MGPAMAVSKELMAIPDFGDGDGGAFAEQKKAIANFKKAILLTAGAAAQKLMMELEHEQEILMNIADMVITTFNAESALLRVMKLVEQRGEQSCTFETDIMNTYLFDAADKIHKYAKEAINAFSDADEQRMMLMGAKRFTKAQPYNTKEARRRIADRLIADGKYPL